MAVNFDVTDVTFDVTLIPSLLSPKAQIACTGIEGKALLVAKYAPQVVNLNRPTTFQINKAVAYDNQEELLCIIGDIALDGQYFYHVQLSMVNGKSSPIADVVIGIGEQDYNGDNFDTINRSIIDRFNDGLNRALPKVQLSSSKKGFVPMVATALVLSMGVGFATAKITSPKIAVSNPSLTQSTPVPQAPMVVASHTGDGHSTVSSDEYVARQKAVLDDTLKSMGIDKTHNPADLSCFN